MSKTIFVIIFASIFNITFAQSPDEQNQLALQYYNNKEFDKASTIFLDLYNSQKSKTYFNYYLNCLVELKDFETAEKWKKAIESGLPGPPSPPGKIGANPFGLRP